MNILSETPRLYIKPPSLDSLEKTYALQSDPDVMRYVDAGGRTRDDVYARLEKMVQHWEKHGFGVGDVYEKSSGAYIGRAGLFYLEMDDAQPEIELGYSLHKKYWNKGYATELAKAWLDWGFRYLPVSKFVAVTYPDNIGSRRVLEKAGMHYVDTVHCYGVEAAKYEIVKND